MKPAHQLVIALAWSAVIGWAMPIGALADVDQEVIRAEAERIEVVRRASACTIAVFGQDGGGGGSGVVITPDGFALTNFHVAQPSGDAMKCGMDDGNLYDAVIVGVDPTGDVALIKLFGRDDFPVAQMADSDKVRVGDWAFAIGNPFLLATDFTPTVSYGIISGVHRYQYPAGTLLEYADCIQTDAAINPGNSGGPLFDARGQLIGINGRGSFEKRGRVNVGVGYAISINQIKNFMGYLHSGRIVDHATLGARASSDEDGRVVVVDILESSDAYRRGLRYDDEIVKFGGRTIRTVNGFKNALGIYPKGWRVPLTYRRDGQTYDVMVRLSGVHPSGQLAERLAGGRRIQPHPKPKPGEEDDEKKERKTPRLPKIKDLKLPKKKPMPKIVKAHFTKKKGYANYYFNRVHQDRVWKGLQRGGDYTSLADTWIFRGDVRTDAGAGEVRFRLGPEDGEAVLPEFHAKSNFGDDLAGNLDPPATGGLLTALHLWQRLLHDGIDEFGQVYYLGTAPLVGHDGLVDILVGIHGGVEARFMLNPQSGRLLALEMFPEEDVDPCEIAFLDYREVDGYFWPHRIEVRYADRLYGEFQLDEFEFEKDSKE